MTMTLFYSPTSPFARKALAAAHERGLANEVAIGQRSPQLMNGLARVFHFLISTMIFHLIDVNSRSAVYLAR